MTWDDHADMIRCTLGEMGGARLTDVSADIKNCAAMSVLLKRDRFSFEDAYPVAGKVETRFGFETKEIRESSSETLVELVTFRRTCALISLIAKLEGLFWASAGKGADPNGWRTVAVRGEWMKEVVGPALGQPLVIAATLSVCIAFEPSEVKPDVIAG